MGLFASGDIWTGVFCELALEYERGVAGGLVTALYELWHLEGLDGATSTGNANLRNSQDMTGR